jgi:hypothetical protein
MGYEREYYEWPDIGCENDLQWYGVHSGHGDGNGRRRVGYVERDDSSRCRLYDIRRVFYGTWKLYER